MSIASPRWGPEFAFRSFHVGFVGGRNGIWIVFLEFLLFSLTKNFTLPFLHTRAENYMPSGVVRFGL